MSRQFQWILGVSALLIAVAIVFSALWPLLGLRLGWLGGLGGWMGQGHMLGGSGMMGGFGMPLFGIGMFLLPLLFAGAVVLGIVWLVRSAAAPGPAQPAAASVFCAHCGKPLQAGWVACPHCGTRTT